MRRILVYKDDCSTTGHMTHSLAETFSGLQCAISSVTINDIRSGVLRQGHKRDLFVIPGIFGEICKYHEDFGTAELSEYYSFLKRGGISLNSCAGASTVARVCNYITPWGTVRKHGLLNPLFKGAANGPLLPYAIQPQSADIESRLPQIANTSIAPLHFKNENNEWEKACISYGNGPALLPDDPAHPDIEILATYTEIEGTPPALIRQAYGAGAAYLCGVHPEIWPFDIETKTPNFKSAAIRAFSDALRPHEEGRKKFWTMLTNLIKADMGIGELFTKPETAPRPL